MRVNDSLRHLGVPRGTYYRWKKERVWEREKAEPVSPVQAFEALPEEKQAVVRYALEHPEIRHREMSWRMVDEDVAYLSASTVYRILRSEGTDAPPTWTRQTLPRRGGKSVSSR